MIEINCLIHSSYSIPHLGRFISKNPIGLLGGNNVYAYAPNLVSWIDSLGLDKEQKEVITPSGSKEIYTRRNARGNDKILTTSRAARREAMRSQNIPTSQTYQSQIHKDSTQSTLSLKQSGRLHVEEIYRDGQKVGTIGVHKDGHEFHDDKTFEKPHYHGKNGEHFSYENGNPRNTNKYVGGCPT